jgi:hypothetical protein
MSDAQQLASLMREFTMRLITAGLIDLASPRRLCVEVDAELAERARDHLATMSQRVQDQMLAEGEEPLAEVFTVQPTDHGRALLCLVQR